MRIEEGMRKRIWSCWRVKGEERRIGEKIVGGKWRLA